jgi:alpha-galactosidase/6-phospho-beta-glucosidase family protein
MFLACQKEIKADTVEIARDSYASISGARYVSYQFRVGSY